MNNRRRWLAVAMAFVLCLGLCACAGKLTQEDVVGTWSGSYEFEGNHFFCTFDLHEDGTYQKGTTKNGFTSSAESGTYEVDGNEVILHKDGNTGLATRYKYRSDKLVNNGHKFTKVA